MPGEPNADAHAPARHQQKKQDRDEQAHAPGADTARYHRAAAEGEVNAHSAQANRAQNPATEHDAKVCAQAINADPKKQHAGEAIHKAAQKPSAANREGPHDAADAANHDNLEHSEHQGHEIGTKNGHHRS